MDHYQNSPAVCFATPEYPPRVGGVSRSAVRIVKYLVEAGFSMHVFVSRMCESAEEAEVVSTVEEGAHVHRVGMVEGISRMMGAFAMSDAIQKVDEVTPFRLFHGFFAPMAFPCMWVANRGQRPVIASIRGADAVDWLAFENRRQVMKLVLERASWVTSVSTDLLEKVSVLAELNGKSSVILNSIDSRAFPAWQPTVENRGVVGTLGEFRHKKDIPLLIQSYAALDSGLRKRLLLVGYYDKPEYAAECESLIEQNNLLMETRLTGLVNDASIPGYLLAMRVFVICSKHDGLPNALLEAAAAGVPIVATSIGGMRDVLTDGENALLVPPEDPVRLTAAIEAVLRDESLARRLSAGARAVAAKLHPDNEKRAWRELYQRMIHGD